jgi:hypothetical protein
MKKGFLICNNCSKTKYGGGIKEDWLRKQLLKCETMKKFNGAKGVRKSVRRNT